jgi:putative MATE family efflux protein
MKKKPDLLSGKPAIIFFWYAFPSIVGMMAISSAFVIDGIFLGNVVGAQALAAVNLTIPFWGFTFSLAIMLSVGGSAHCGRLLGANQKAEAAHVFSQIFFSALLISICISLPTLIFPEVIGRLLGANPIIMPDVITYLKNYCWFLPFIFMGIGLTSFGRVNQAPELVFFALVLSASLNLFLDWLLIVNFSMGLKGAAIASGFSQSVVFFILFSSFFRRSSSLHLVKPNLDIKPVSRAAFNGFSEFVNEISSGIIVLIFNFVLMKKYGIDAVAAFTVINYIVYLWFMVAYSAGESIQAPVSVNVGANKWDRSVSFFTFGLFFNLTVSSVLVLALLIWPDEIMNIFLKDNEPAARNLIHKFFPLVLPVFLLSGCNIMISAFFTAQEKALSSLTISLLRTLILPISFVVFFYHFFEFYFIFLAMSIAEFITLLIAGLLMHKFLSLSSHIR